MNLRQLPILEMRKVYMDNLATWIEVPVFEQDEVIKLVSEIDWEDLEMWQYKKILIDHWNKLPASVKAKRRNPEVRDELYEALVNENWALKPALEEAFYTPAEAMGVQVWFASGKARGRQPEVIGG